MVEVDIVVIGLISATGAPVMPNLYLPKKFFLDPKMEILSVVVVVLVMVVVEVMVGVVAVVVEVILVVVIVVVVEV